MGLQTQMERIASKGQVIPLLFTQDAVAASQTDADLPIMDGANAVDAFEAPYSFDIIAQSWTLSAAASAGSLTINPTIGGTAQTGIQSDVTTAAAGSDTGVVTGTAGDAIGVQIDTDGSWDATTADLAVTLFVMFYLDDI